MGRPLEELIREKKIEIAKAKIRTWLQNTSFYEFVNVVEQRIIGQPELRPLLFVVYNYLECIVYERPIKHNMIIAGPSGCGKTELYRTLRSYFLEKMDLSITCVDMSNITTSGFKGADPADILRPYAESDACSGFGIIFLDEFDKRLTPQYTSSGGHESNVSEEVQGALLKIIEGGDIMIPKLDTVNTENLCFIAMGSFADTRRKRVEEAKQAVCIGFNRDDENSEIKKGKDIYMPIEKSDVTGNGAMIELMARFPYLFNFMPLQDNYLDKLIDKVRDDVEKNLIRAKLRLEPQMIGFLKENIKTEYGVRKIDEILREKAMRVYMEESIRRMDMFEHHILLITLTGENSHQVAFREMTEEEQKLFSDSEFSEVFPEEESEN